MSACGGLKNSRLENYLAKSNCNQQNIYNYDATAMPVPFYKLQLDTSLINHFSFKSLNVAHAIGILNLLQDYVVKSELYKKEPNIQHQVDLMQCSQILNQRINSASLEISAVASEMDCEEERTSQIAEYLKKIESEKETRLTVGSIIVGASGAILSGVFNKDNTGEYIGIGTGIAEAGLGILILINHRKTDFKHPRNALKDIWEGHFVSANFPPSIWYYLNYFNPAEPEKNSLRYQIIQKWIDFGQISETKSKKKRSALIDIYFGEGGKYSTDQLSNRANMYDQVESHINLMKQDLKSLSIELENFK